MVLAMSKKSFHLHTLARTFKYDEFLECLAANPNEVFDGQTMALHLFLASEGDRVDPEVDFVKRSRVVQQLLDWKADVNASDNDVVTIFQAVQIHDARMIGFLLDHGAEMKGMRLAAALESDSIDFPMVKEFMLRGASLEDFKSVLSGPTEVMKNFYENLVASK